jgi:hypothetical protein
LNIFESWKWGKRYHFVQCGRSRVEKDVDNSEEVFEDLDGKDFVIGGRVIRPGIEIHLEVTRLFFLNSDRTVGPRK